MIRRFMADQPGTPRVFIIGTNLGHAHFLLAEFDPLETLIRVNDSTFQVIGCEMINLGIHRGFVDHHIKEADKYRVVGD